MIFGQLNEMLINQSVYFLLLTYVMLVNNIDFTVHILILYFFVLNKNKYNRSVIKYLIFFTENALGQRRLTVIVLTFSTARRDSSTSNREPHARNMFVLLFVLIDGVVTQTHYRSTTALHVNHKEEQHCDAWSEFQTIR